MSGARPPGVPGHLPPRLAITLWDFSWYTRAGDVFLDLAARFAEARDRGYNAIRVCAMPLLLFGEHDLPDRSALTVSGMGNGFGAGTRWYDGRATATFDPLTRLAELFDLAARFEMVVILSSWEYQQSAAFSHTSAWYDMLERIPRADRFDALARAFDRMLDWLSERDRLDRVAYVELHNEVDVSRFDTDTFRGGPRLHRERIESGVAWLRARHPETLVTVAYGRPPITRLAEVPDNLQVAHIHLYPYGVLGALNRTLGLDEGDSLRTTGIPDLFPPDAPPVTTHRPDQDWRLFAGVVSPELAYVFDYADPVRYDQWLYAHYLQWRQETRTRITLWLECTAQWARSLNAPVVVGEGYLGYTPLRSTFEDGPVGKEVTEYAVREANRLNVWGLVVSSNCAPQHPAWADVAWQRIATDVIRGTRSFSPAPAANQGGSRT